MTEPETTMYWNPSWLRRPVLFLFTSLFVLLATGLALMWYLVKHYDGIPLTLTTNHYVWTYGPTAIFTVVVSLWRQVNYCTMVSQPWHELHQSPQPAARTVLLDYMWPLQVTSFIAALKNKHQAVAITITIFALLKIVMVISTTLFVLGYTSLSQETHAQLLTKFDATNYRNSMRSGHRYIVTSDPVWDYLNLQEQYQDASPPLQPSTAFTDFSIRSELPRGADTASTQVDVFQVNVTCEVPTIKWSQNGPAKSFNLTLETPSCDIGTIEVAACNPQNSAFCTPTSNYFESGLVSCTGGQGYASVDIDDIRGTPNQYRLVITAIEGDVSLASDPDTWPASFDVNVRRIAAVACGVEYSIKRGVALGSAFDSKKINSLHIVDGVGRKINNLTDPEILAGVFVSASYQNTTTDSDSIILIYSNGLDLLGLLAGSRIIEPSTFDSLLDVSLLQNRAEQTLTGLSHQVMRRYFLLPDNTTTPSSVVYTEEKLYLRQVALWAMVGLLATISCLSIAVITHSKQRAAPHSPATLATVAHTVSRSPAMVTLLSKSSAMRLSQIRKILDGYDFVTTQDWSGAPCVNAVAVTREKELPKPPPILSRMWEALGWKKKRQLEVSKPKKKSPWVPYSGRTHAIALTMILPTTAIATLEVLWYLSENVEHFITITSDSSITAYAIRYSSTATVLIISTLFNSLDFAIASITPFSALAAGNAIPERTMLFSIVGDLPPVALYKSLFHMHFGAALSLVASTVGSLLTIAISGLWFNTAIEISRDITAEAQSGWNFIFMGNSVDSTFNQYISEDTTNLFSDLEHGLPDEATLIWNNIVLPRIGNPQSSVTSQLKDIPSSGSPYYNIAVPAIRPILECSVLPSSAIAVTEEPSSTPPIQRRFSATIEIPFGCINVYAPADHARTEEIWYDVYDHTSSGWIGQLIDLSVVLSSSKASSEGCPSLGAIFGTYESLDLQTRQHRFNLTALSCTQRLQSVEANVTYPGDFSSLFAPNLTTDVHLNSPAPVNIIDAQSGGSSLSTRVGNAFASIELSGSIDDTNAFDNFFRLLVDGPQGTSRENLLGRKNSDTVISAMNNLYQRFMVRVIDRDWRSIIGAGNTTRALPNGGVANGTIKLAVSRLKLSETAKIILQAFLGTMVVLGGLAWWCVDLRVLPRNPYPIASSMALFAGSRLIGASSPESSDVSGQVPPRLIKRKPVVIIKRRKFRLGWWDAPRIARDDARESDPMSQSPTETRRFGIDFEDTSVSSAPLETNGTFRRRFR
ncbi:hypothetical protein F5Y08DRAFT_348042 [Xylaria arbuscula]|nr:hypothetical protein F5Y08DRAFT_348042 [Xylaria arbuscula]